MHCTNCGTEYVHGSLSCSNCGSVIPQFPDALPNYLWQSIAVTVCCCLPFGIAAIVFAAQVNSKLQGGNLAGALDSSRKARMFCWIAFGLGLAAQGAYLLLILFGAVAGGR